MVVVVTVGLSVVRRVVFEISILAGSMIIIIIILLLLGCIIIQLVVIAK